MDNYVFYANEFEELKAFRDLNLFLLWHRTSSLCLNNSSLVDMLFLFFDSAYPRQTVTFPLKNKLPISCGTDIRYSIHTIQ